MSKRALAVLALLAAGLSVYVFLFERSSVTSKERAERAGRVLVSFVRDKVDRLELERKGQRVVLEREAKEGELGGWQMRAPIKVKADDDAVDQLLGELEWLSARRTVTLTPEDEKRYGLSAPRYRVRFRVAGETHLLTLGHDDVHGESVYARIDRAPEGVVVPKTVIEALAHEPGHFREKQLFSDLTVSWAQKLTLTQGTEQTELTKEGGRWWLHASAPGRGYADGKRIDELLRALAELRAARYLEPNEQAAGAAALAQPERHIEVKVVPDETREDKSPKLLRLELAGPCSGHAGEHYARASAQGAAAVLVCLSDEALKPLALSREEAREGRLFGADPSAIERVELTRGADKQALMRAGEQWKLAAEAVDRDAVETWLADLAAARATRFVALSGFRERGSLLLELGEGKRERVAFGELDAAGELPVKRGDEPLLAMFPSSLFDRLEPTPKRFHSLEIWAAYQPSQVVRVEATAEGRARTLALEGTSWRALASSPQAAVDSERVRELVRALIDLRARAYVTDRERPAHGFTGVRPRIQLTLDKGGALSLELGASTERGAYARFDGSVIEVGSEVSPMVSELAGAPRPPPARPLPDARTESDDLLDDEHAQDDDHEH